LRTCLNCLSDKTKIRGGRWPRPSWYKHKDGFLCHKCYNRLIYKPKWRFIHGSYWNHRRMKFIDKQITLKENPRIGICSWCCAVVGVNCKRTGIHHIAYHSDNPLKDAIELCASCHGKESWRIRKL